MTTSVAFRDSVFRMVDPAPGMHNHGFYADVASGRWEPETLDFVEQTAGAGAEGRGTFLDIGAWIGPITLYAATRFGRVVAVEPDPVALGHLRQNIGNNADRITAEVDVRPVALVPSRERQAYVQMDPRTGEWGSSSSRVTFADSGANFVVGHTHLRDLVTPDVRAVKIDIEGMEEHLIADIGAHIPATTPLLLSLHPAFFRNREGSMARMRRMLERKYGPIRAPWQDDFLTLRLGGPAPGQAGQAA